MKNILRFILIVVLIIAGLSLICNGLKPKRYKPVNKVETPIVNNEKVINDEKVAEIETPPSFDKANILDNQIDGEFIPIRIIIPQTNVDTEIEPMETIAGQLQAPKNFSIVGWDKTRVPLVTNTIIMDGHYDSKKGPAVFYNLKSLKPDDKIYILSENEILIYNVTLIEAYDRLNAPIEKIYGDNGKKKIKLDHMPWYI